MLDYAGLLRVAQAGPTGFPPVRHPNSGWDNLTSGAKREGRHQNATTTASSGTRRQTSSVMTATAGRHAPTADNVGHLGTRRGYYPSGGTIPAPSPVKCISQAERKSPSPSKSPRSSQAQILRHRPRKQRTFPCRPSGENMAVTAINRNFWLQAVPPLGPSDTESFTRRSCPSCSNAPPSGGSPPCWGGVSRHVSNPRRKTPEDPALLAPPLAGALSGRGKASGESPSM